MLRTPAPLSRALYVGGLKVRERWLAEAFESHGSAAVFYRLFARVLLAGRAHVCDSSENEIESVVAVRHHAKLWKAKRSRVGGKVQFSASLVLWFTRAGSLGGLAHPRTTSQQLSYCVPSLSESARS